MADVVDTAAAPEPFVELKPSVIAAAGARLVGETGVAISEHPTLKVNSATPTTPNREVIVMLCTPAQ